MTTTPSSAFQAENLSPANSTSPAPPSTTSSPISRGPGRGEVRPPAGLIRLHGRHANGAGVRRAAEIKSYQDVKGKTLALDAVETGFAFVLYEMLAKAGLGRRLQVRGGRRDAAALGGGASAGKHAAPSPSSRSPASPSPGLTRARHLEQQYSRSIRAARSPRPRLGGGQCRRAQGLHQGLSRRSRLDAEAGRTARTRATRCCATCRRSSRRSLAR